MEDEGGIHEGRARRERRRGANSSWRVKKESKGRKTNQRKIE
jgi:hypothetical protein